MTQLTTVPLFGVTTNFHINLMDTDLTIDEIGEALKGRDQFNTLMEEVDDHKDPITVDISTDSATFSALRKGKETIERGDDGFKTFYAKIVDAVKEMSTKLLTPEEEEARKLTRAVDLAELLKPIKSGDYKVLPDSKDHYGVVLKVNDKFVNIYYDSEDTTYVISIHPSYDNVIYSGHPNGPDFGYFYIVKDLESKATKKFTVYDGILKAEASFPGDSDDITQLLDKLDTIIRQFTEKDLLI